ncbi:MAG: glycosyltransferase [Deltaproteobacteria bacterium RIFCSPLOWO2_12_FULL_38_8]|nr:MAG: glycosyltransferase [Deltaproteobacteria bacterium RIFCSPLOWO2_12_FULL_38_8]
MSKFELITVVVPVYNEETGLNEFYKRLSTVLKTLDLDYEIIFVNDGSTDHSIDILHKLKLIDTHIKIISFSRNFGHQIAIKAGIDFATGDALIIMDADLQDPPESIPAFIEKWKEGFEVVHGHRVQRKKELLLKKITAYIYYRLVARTSQIQLPLDVGDFKLISRNVYQQLKNINERGPYIRGLIIWIGFKQTLIPIYREPRFSGDRKYSWFKLCKLAWSGIVHFSFLPLQICTVIGILTVIFCFICATRVLYLKLFANTDVPGWTSLMITVLFLGSIQLLTMGLQGGYISRIYDETKRRPLYIIENKEGF